MALPTVCPIISLNIISAVVTFIFGSVLCDCHNHEGSFSSKFLAEWMGMSGLQSKGPAKNLGKQI